MNIVFLAILSGLSLFVLMLVASEAGRRIGVARLARHPDGLAKGAGSAEAATFALFGLLVAFTFSGAASRFEDRRHLIAAEANAVGTSYLRLDLLPSDAQPALRELFRKYLDVRYQVYRQASDDTVTQARLAEAAALQAMIWDLALAAVQQEGTSTSTASMVLGSLNEMIDITGTREAATRNHPPLVVYLLLAAFGILCSLLVGYGTSQNTARSWLHTLTFAVAVSLTVYVIVDLEFPRAGFIRVDAADEALAQLRESLQ